MNLQKKLLKLRNDFGKFAALKILPAFYLYTSNTYFDIVIQKMSLTISSTNINYLEKCLNKYAQSPQAKNYKTLMRGIRQT